MSHTAARVFELGCWVLLACVGAAMANEIWKAAFQPISLAYGEGLLSWMGKTMSEFRSPYGDILAVPSRNSCYGPLAPLLSLLFKPMLVAPEGMPGVTGAYAGRLLTGVSWVVAGTCVYHATRGGALAKATGALLVPAVFSGTFFLYSFRIDPVLCAAEAALLLAWTRVGSHFSGIVAGVAGGAIIGAIKPTAMWEIGFVFLTARHLSGMGVTGAWRWLVAGILSGIVVVAVSNAVSGGWMLQNILTDQSLSGWRDADGMFKNLQGLFLSPGCLVPLAFFVVLASKGEIGGVETGAIVVLVLLCGLLFFKAGADSNYFMPAILCSAPVFATRIWQAGLTKALIVTLSAALLPLPSHFSPESFSDAEEVLFGAVKVTNFVGRAPTVSDDAFYEVAAGKEPLVTDFFQLATVLEKKKATLADAFRYSKGRGWGGWRMEQALEGEIALNKSLFKTPRGTVWNRQAAAYSGVEGGRIPHVCSKGGVLPLLLGWVKSLLVPGFVLVWLAAGSGGLWGKREIVPRRGGR